MERTERIVIFAGTTEGRELSDRLCAAGVRHCVCVVSEYGSRMLRPDENREVHVGRMDAVEMNAFLLKRGFGAGDIIVDATHPYAAEASRNIAEAAEECGAEYIRVLRRNSDEAEEGVCLYEDMAACASAVDGTEGNILLTTGSRELPVYRDTVSDETLKRTYARVLPSAESLAICEECGIDPTHIIAMHGPFSTGLNLEILKQYDIAHLITKQSGTQGGFDEKKEAARICGAVCHVITRPFQEEGRELKEVYSMLTGMDWNKKELKMIYLIGVGMGSEATMTVEARDAIRNADIVFGAARLIRDISKPLKYPMYLARDIIPELESRDDIESCAVLFSGDSGFYSGAAGMYRALKEWDNAPEIRIMPGISSVSYLAAALGVSYEDAAIHSLHGRNSDADVAAVMADVRVNAKTFVLLSGVEDARRLTGMIHEEGLDVQIQAGCDMSCEGGRVCSAEEIPGDTRLITLMISNRKPERRRLISVLRDEDVIRGKVPMTKEIIRHESIIRLGLREGDVLYDIGGGTGSVTAEAAMLSPSLRVYTIEKKKEACELIRENLQKNRLANVTLTEGDAVDVIKDLEKPDCVFIGGSDGRMRGIIDEISRKGSGIRVVINAISLETIEEIMGILREREISDEEMVRIAVSDIRRVGRYHLPRTNNEVTIISFTL